MNFTNYSITANPLQVLKFNSNFSENRYHILRQIALKRYFARKDSRFVKLIDFILK